MSPEFYRSGWNGLRGAGHSAATAFPAITVPAWFTTVMYDRIRVPSMPESASGDEDSETEIVGPVPARVPVGMDIVVRPFGEPTILRIAAAYEAARRGIASRPLISGRCRASPEPNRGTGRPDPCRRETSPDVEPHRLTGPAPDEFTEVRKSAQSESGTASESCIVR